MRQTPVAPTRTLVFGHGVSHDFGSACNEFRLILEDPESRIAESTFNPSEIRLSIDGDFPVATLPDASTHFQTVFLSSGKLMLWVNRGGAYRFTRMRARCSLRGAYFRAVEESRQSPELAPWVDVLPDE